MCSTPRILPDSLRGSQIKANKGEVIIKTNEAAPRVRVFPVPQCNPRVVNIHLAKHGDLARTLAESLRDTVLAAWVARLKGYRDSRPYRFLVEMEDALANSPSAPPRSPR